MCVGVREEGGGCALGLGKREEGSVLAGRACVWCVCVCVPRRREGVAKSIWIAERTRMVILCDDLTKCTFY